MNRPDPKPLGVVVFALALGVAGCHSPEPLEGGADDAAPSRASVLLSREWVAPGGSAEIGILIALMPGWHTYADPPGDSGMAPIVTAQAPDGMTVGTRQLPPPQRFVDPAGTTFGYEDQVLIRLPLTVGPEWTPRGAADIALHVDYLVCKTECVPQSAEFIVTIPLRAGTAPETEAWNAILKRGGWASGAARRSPARATREERR